MKNTAYIYSPIYNAPQEAFQY